MTRSTARLAQIARRSHGVFVADDLARCQVPNWPLQRLIADGWCDRLAPGVYRLAGAPRTAEQALTVALAHHGPGAAASHGSAAALWSIPGHHLDRLPTITIAAGCSQRSRLADLRVSGRFPAGHRTVRRGFAVTTPARTVFDVAGDLRPPRVERILDDLLHRKLCTLAQVEGVLFALASPGRAGSVAVRTILEERSEGVVPPASELERRARAVLRQAALPVPDFEVNLGDDAWIGRVDCLWRAERLVVELDGRRFHGGRLAREADRQRDNRLMAQGWRVLRVTWADITERPGEVVTLIRHALSD